MFSLGRFADLVYPQAPHDDIMNGDNRLAPGIVTLGAVEDNMAAANGSYCEVLATKLGGSCELLPEGPILVLNVLGKHRRMVTHLGREGGREGGRQAGREGGEREAGREGGRDGGKKMLHCQVKEYRYCFMVCVCVCVSVCGLAKDSA